MRRKLTDWRYVGFKSGLELMQMVCMSGAADTKKD